MVASLSYPTPKPGPVQESGCGNWKNEVHQSISTKGIGGGGKSFFPLLILPVLCHHACAYIYIYIKRKQIVLLVIYQDRPAESVCVGLGYCINAVSFDVGDEKDQFSSWDYSSPPREKKACRGVVDLERKTVTHVAARPCDSAPVWSSCAAPSFQTFECAQHIPDLDRPPLMHKRKEKCKHAGADMLCAVLTKTAETCVGMHGTGGPVAVGR